MPFFLVEAVASLPCISGDSEDISQNTFHFYNEVDPGSAMDVVNANASRVIDYYTDDQGEPDALGKYINDSVVRTTNGCYVDWREVNIATGERGAVLRHDTFTLDVGDDIVPLPRECAIVSSFHGALAFIEEEGPGNTRPAARRRGRRYIGPLNYAAATVVDDIARPSTLVTDLIVAIETALSDGLGQVVYSRAGGAVYGVVGGYVDNEFDTQRRRGMDATARTSWTI